MNQKKIEEIIDDLSLEAKASLCSGKGSWNTKAIKEAGIPGILMTDGPHGVRKVREDIDDPGIKDSYEATCYPTASGLAASWNLELLNEVGLALGQEAGEMGVKILLGPGANIKRSPLGGRNFEYFSEDPYLSGKLAAAYINGVQSQGVGTSLKHFVANNQEFRRMSINAEISERALREIYLKSFEIAVKEASPWSLMCAYNRVNGRYCSEHPRLLTEILREEWGFEGIVISDWGAVNDRVAGLKAGLELEMPGSHGIRDQEIVAAVENKELAEEVLDEAVRRLLKTIFKTENQEALAAEQAQVSNYNELAYRAAAESMVLLKNEDILPFENENKIAVIGEMAVNLRRQGQGSSYVKPAELDDFLESFKKNLSETAEITYDKGYRLEYDETEAPGSNQDQDYHQLIKTAKANAAEAELAIIFAGLPEKFEAEGQDRADLKIPENQEALINEIASIQPNTIVVLTNGAPVEIPWRDKVAAILEGYLGGQSAGRAIADIITGQVSPSGKLAETFPQALADTPAHLNFPGERDRVIYGEDIYVGYRYYDQKEIEPAYPFGHGLSYTSFTYDNMIIDQNLDNDNSSTEQNAKNEKVNQNLEEIIAEVSFTITNTGFRTGREIAQLYISAKDSQVRRPVKELKGFNKVQLEPGQSKELKFAITAADLSYYEPEIANWLTEAGNYQISIGSSSRDIRLCAEIKISNPITAGESGRPEFHQNSTIGDIYQDQKAWQILQAEIADKPELQQFISFDNKEADIGIPNFLEYLPLRNLITFTGGQFTGEDIQQIVKKLNQK
ncbi:MAG: glycoside hydrolase family 3 C-terminal domain-containing protein [Halarsenatibacteraceae bacterium]